MLVRSDKSRMARFSIRDFADILNDPTIDTGPEVIGGPHPTYEYVTAALWAGKRIVIATQRRLKKTL